MEKKVIKLSESDLHNIIENAVKQIIKESENIDEGLWDTAKSFIGQYGNRGAQKAQQIGQAAGNKMRQGVSAMRQGAQNAANKVQQGYNNIKSDIQQTAQNAKQDSSMKEMQKAFNNFKMAVQKFKANGGQVNRQLGSRIAGIENMIGSYQAHY